jgi:hypothetical protein
MPPLAFTVTWKPLPLVDAAAGRRRAVEAVTAGQHHRCRRRVVEVITVP